MAMTGRKRRAEEELQDQRFAKKFDLLNIAEHSGKLYLPVRQSSAQRTQGDSPRHDGESMQVDDTKDRVYIRNLDDELAEIEPEEDRLVFIPDIEKKLGKIPKSVLLGESYPSTGNQIVLYGVPTSLSVPEEHDKVRKAIIESRARAREKQVHDAEASRVDREMHVSTPNLSPASTPVSAQSSASSEQDEDAMDIG